MSPAAAAVLIACLALAGAAVGSFSGVVAERGWAASLAGRSRCSTCDRTLHWWELVPLLSWPALGGRCHGCGARIPAALLLREVAGAALGGAVAAAVLLLVAR